MRHPAPGAGALPAPPACPCPHTCGKSRTIISRGRALSATTHPFARLWRGYLRRFFWLFVVALILMTIEGGTIGLLAWMLEPMFDRVFVAGQADAIFWVGAGVFGLFLVRAVTGVLQRVILVRIATKVTARMQQDLLDHVMRLDSAYFSSNSPGMLIERVQGDVATIQSIWMTLVTSVGRDLVGLVSLMIVAISVDPLWAAIAVVGAPLLILPSVIVQRYIKRKAYLLRDIAGRRTTRLDEIFHGITPIKLNAMEGYQFDRYRRTSEDLIRASIRSQTGKAIVPAMVDVAVGLGFFMVLLYGGPQIVAGEKTVGEFMSFFTAMSLAFQPLRRLATLSGSYQTMMASLERIYSLRDTVPTILGPVDHPADVSSTTVRFEGVELSYGDSEVLRGVAFEVPEGTTTALVGQSGAGKSTIFNVLTRLVDPAQGRVTIGGQDIREMPLEGLRGLFSVVSQDTLLFDETLRENLLVGRRGVGEAQLQAALDAAHVTEFLGDMPGGLDAPAGPRGSNLSGGQRQRIAIARALLRDTPILLLDEATSALDTRSEKLVQAALETLAEKRTTLVIAHRLSTIRDADQILVLDQGQVVERGTHAELLALGGQYTQLYTLQFGAQTTGDA